MRDQQALVINLVGLIKRQWKLCMISLLTLITIFSIWPAEFLPPVPGTDKTHHLIAYALLMLPVALRKPHHWWFLMLGFIAYSGLIELVQPYVNRYGEWLDLLANTVGLVCGLVLAELVNLWIKRRQTNQ